MNFCLGKILSHNPLTSVGCRILQGLNGFDNPDRWFIFIILFPPMEKPSMNLIHENLDHIPLRFVVHHPVDWLRITPSGKLYPF